MRSGFDRSTWPAAALAAVAWSAASLPGLAVAAAAPPPGSPATAPPRESMQQLPRLQPKQVITVTGKEDWALLRGFGKEAGMAEMMTLMMVGGSGMEHMKMPAMPGRARPAASPPDGAMPQSAEGQTSRFHVAATLSPNPPVVGENRLTLRVIDTEGKPVTGLRLTSSVTMNSMDMGTEHPPAIEGPAGLYTTVVRFIMKGPWRVQVTGGAPGAGNTGGVRAVFDFDAGSPAIWTQAAPSPESGARGARR